MRLVIFSSFYMKAFNFSFIKRRISNETEGKNEKG